MVNTVTATIVTRTPRETCQTKTTRYAPNVAIAATCQNSIQKLRSAQKRSIAGSENTNPNTASARVDSATWPQPK